MLKKIWSIAALLSSAAALNACQTSAGKPVNCLPAFEMKGRCAKVPQSVKDQHRSVLTASPLKPKSKAVGVPDIKSSIMAPQKSSLTAARPPAKQHVYVPKPPV